MNNKEADNPIAIGSGTYAAAVAQRLKLCDNTITVNMPDSKLSRDDVYIKQDETT